MTAVASIASVATVPVRLNVHPDLVVRGAAGEHAYSGFLLVRVTLSNGVEGYGEVSATPTWSGEDEVTADHHIRTRLARAVVGLPITDVARVDDRMDAVLAGNAFTKAGLSIALWDAYARDLGVPLAEVLGGIQRRVVPIKCSLSGDEAHLRRTHTAAARRGFTAFKVKVGMDVEGDIARVALARRLAGPDALLGTDANTGWTRDEALRAMEGFAPYDVAFVEQPLARRDLAGMAALRGLGVPIVADESVGDVWDLRAVVAAGAADVASIYVGMSGGPARAVAMAAEATAAGLDVVIGSNGEMGIGAAAQLHVACAIPGLSDRIPSDIIGSFYYSEETLATALPSDGTTAVLTDGPGLGVVPRPDLVASLRECAS